MPDGEPPEHTPRAIYKTIANGSTSGQPAETGSHPLLPASENTKKNFVFTFVSALLLCLCACSAPHPDVPAGVAEALKLAGKNKSELLRVIEHYQQAGDSLGLEAAYFLIENMPGKYSTVPRNGNDTYRQAFAAMPLNDPIGWDPAQSAVAQYFDSVRQAGAVPRTERISDLEAITAGYLITNIDLAFRAWERFGGGARYPFDVFCNYVLPYRDGNEPIDDWREKGYERFGSVLDSLADPLAIARHIVSRSEVHYNAGMARYPYPLAFGEVTGSGMGSCEHMSFYLTQALRAVGVPAATEIVPAWANRSAGHQWNMVLDTTGHPVDIGFGPGASNDVLYKIAKIYRRTYRTGESVRKKSGWLPQPFDYPDYTDVTAEYDMPVSALRITPVTKKLPETAYLCTFDNRSWTPVAKARATNGCFDFGAAGRGVLFGKNRIFAYRQEGKGIVYLPATFGRLNAFEPLTPPVILFENGDTCFLQPDTSRTRAVTLYRKYPEYSHISIYAERMKGGRFEASDSRDFGRKEIIHTIDEAPAYTVTEAEVTPSAASRYIRYVAPDSSWVNVGELAFYPEADTSRPGTPAPEALRGTPFSSSAHATAEEMGRAFDGNVETFYAGELTHAFIGLDFGRPVSIRTIRYAPRTDNNAVFPGDEYELFYWDGGWKSLGRKTADNYSLIFEEVPENSLLLLHNRSRGKEERIFTYENGKQVWW